MKTKPKGKAFEKEVEFTFAPMCRACGVNFLAFMPVPTAPTMVNGRFYRVLSGKAPFDVYGMMNTGAFIGAEVKHTVKEEKSLAIVAPGKKGSGLQHHQLEALATVAQGGGVARIVWCCGGQLLYLANKEIVSAFDTYGTNGGRKSIPAAMFSECEQKEFGGVPYFDWLGEL